MPCRWETLLPQISYSCVLYMPTYVLHIPNYKEPPDDLWGNILRGDQKPVLHQTPRTNTHKCNVLEKVWFTCCWVQSRMTVIGREGTSLGMNQASLSVTRYSWERVKPQVHSPSGESVPEGIDYPGLLLNGVHWWTVQANGNFRTVGNGII